MKIRHFKKTFKPTRMQFGTKKSHASRKHVNYDICLQCGFLFFILIKFPKQVTVSRRYHVKLFTKWHPDTSQIMIYRSKLGR